MKPAQVARELRVSTKSASLWRRRWRAGGTAALASRGAGGAVCRLSAAQLACGARLLDRASERSITGSGLGGLLGWDHRWVIFSVGYLLVRCLLRGLAVLARREVSKDAVYRFRTRHTGCELRLGRMSKLGQDRCSCLLACSI